MTAIDYKRKALQYLAIELATEDTGMYPQAVIDKNGVRKERTDWQDGWNACAMDTTKKACKIGDFLEEAPREVVDLILTEDIRLSVRDEEVKMWVLCNDLFFWACADGEDFDLSDLDDFNQAFKDSPDNGQILWCCRKRGMRPQKPYYKYFSKEEALLFDACGPDRSKTTEGKA